MGASRNIVSPQIILVHNKTHAPRSRIGAAFFETLATTASALRLVPSQEESRITTQGEACFIPKTMLCMENLQNQVLTTLQNDTARQF